jgi:type II secretory pathway component PulC
VAGGSPQLKISGIVWHEEPAKRRAVVNGSFTSEGSVIEGVKIVEIFPTKVRFLHQGRYFEVSVF